MVGATLATARLKAGTTQIWAGGMPKNFLSCCAVRASLSLTHGMSYKNRALKLNPFARFAGPVEIDSVAPETDRRFLDGDRPVTTGFNKFSALKMFFRFALSRGYATHNPLPISQPKSPRQFRLLYERLKNFIPS